MASLLSLSYEAYPMDHVKKSTHYSSSDSRFINVPTESKFQQMGLMDTLGIIKTMLLDKDTRIPEGKLEEVKPDMAAFLAPSTHTKFIWLGHSTLLLNLDGKIVLIDPVFSDYAFSIDIFVKRFQDAALKLEELPHIDAILISHNHYDHLDKKTIQFFKDKDTRFILPLKVGDDLLDWGIPKERFVELDWEDSVTEFGIKFTATPAQHFSGRGLFDKNKSLWASWVIESKNDKIFYSGDSGYSNHFKQIGDKYGPFDVTFIENGQYNERWADIHMLPEESIQAHIDLKGKYYVPVHWGMFNLALHNWVEPVERTYKLAQDKKLSYLSPKLGEIINLENVSLDLPWWKKSK
jgi:L-ascorbate metabolism protein UlaG (beta-lactamase superfamily)